MSRKKNGARIAKARIADFESAILDLESRAEASRRAVEAERPIGGNGLNLSRFDETSSRKVRTARGSVKGFRRESTRVEFIADDSGIRPDDRNAYRVVSTGGFEDRRFSYETVEDGETVRKIGFAGKSRELLAGDRDKAGRVTEVRAWGPAR